MVTCDFQQFFKQKIINFGYSSFFGPPCIIYRVGLKVYFAHLLFCRAYFPDSHDMLLFAYNFQEPST